MRTAAFAMIEILNFAGLPLLVAGCATFQFDYKAPSEGEMAKVVVTSKWDGYNQRVVMHGDNICAADDAKLTGLLHAGAVGQKTTDKIDLTVLAHKSVSISIPQIYLDSAFILPFVVGRGYGFYYTQADFTLCQPVATFTPEAGKSYKVNFGICDAQVIEMSFPRNFVFQS